MADLRVENLGTYGCTYVCECLGYGRGEFRHADVLCVRAGVVCHAVVAEHNG